MKRKILFAAAFAVAMTCCAGSTYAQQKKESQNRNTIFIDGDVSIDHSEDGHRYKVRMQGSKITQLIVDGKEIPESEYPKYEPMIKKLMEQAEKDRVQAEKDREQAEKDRAQAEKDRVRAEQDRQQADRHREQAEKDRAQAEKDRERAEVDRQQAVKDRENAEKDRKQSEVDRAQAEKHRAQAELDRKRAEEDRVSAARDREQAEKDRARAEVDRKRAEEDRKLYEAMIEEVVSEKLVENRNAIKSLTLDENELIINNEKQPAAVHQKFKSKYLKDGKGRIRYGNSGTYRGISVD
jgi:colicin import membrane protein